MALELSSFPERLRVLVVDDDPVCLKITARMLNHCNYDVVEILKATDALKTLEKNPKDFDLMITDVYNDVEILSLLAGITKISGDIPVVLITGAEDNSKLIDGVLHGAKEVISKPVALTKIKTLWQHVYRKRMLKNPRERLEPLEVNDVDDPRGSSSSSRNDGGDEVDDGSDDRRRKKKIRVRWQGDLQEKFTDAVQRLGGPEKAVPKKILELMNVPGISRESVASHLQKCRKQKKPLPLADRNDGSAVVSSSSLSSIFSGFSAHPLPPSLPHPFVPHFRYHQPLPPPVASQPLPPLPMAAQPLPLAVAAQPLASVSVDDLDLSWLDEVLDNNTLSSHINGNI